MRLILLLCITLLQCSDRKVPINDFGTIIMASICKDGIVVAADSRKVMLDDKGQIFAYSEGNKKIYQIRDIIIASSGQHMFDSSLTLAGVLNKFEKAKTLNLNVANFYSQFMDFSKKNLPLKAYDNLLSNHFIICGYFNNKPFIYKYHGNVKEVFAQGFASNTTFGNNESKYINEFMRMNNVKAGNLFTSAFLKSLIERDNTKAIGMIGGDLSVVNIFSKNITWVKSQNNQVYESQKDFVRAYKKGLVKLKYRSKEDSIILKLSIDDLKYP